VVVGVAGEVSEVEPEGERRLEDGGITEVRSVEMDLEVTTEALVGLGNGWVGAIEGDGEPSGDDVGTDGNTMVEDGGMMEGDGSTIMVETGIVGEGVWRDLEGRAPTTCSKVAMGGDEVVVEDMHVKVDRDEYDESDVEVVLFVNEQYGSE
jgi:hypothetical protein